MRLFKLLFPFWFFIFDWSSLSPNQTVSFTNAQTSGIGTKKLLPTSDKQMTKQDVLEYLNNDITLASFANKANNQLVVKQDLAALAFSNSATVYYYHYSGGCVTPETSIQIDSNKTMLAKDIKPGDSVYTINEANNHIGKYKVQRIRRSNQPTLTVFCGKQILSASFTHKLYNGRKYVETQNLSPGDSVQANYILQKIDSIKRQELKEVIELSIEDAHTYIANGFTSHNKIAYFDGWPDASSACLGSTANSFTVYYNGTLGNGTQLYASPGGSYANGIYDITHYFKIGNNTFYLSDGQYNGTGTMTIQNWAGCYNEVYLTVTTDFSNYGSARSVVRLFSDAAHTTPVAADTRLTVSIAFDDDLNNHYSTIIYVALGTSSASKTTGVDPNATSTANEVITDLSPNPSSGQHYNY